MKEPSHCSTAFVLPESSTGDIAATMLRAGNTDTMSEDQSRQRLDNFLESVEKRAFTIAKISTRNRDDALDIVQDAMMKLAVKYAHKPEDSWRPLFYRILSNRLNDWHRKRSVRDRFHRWTRSGASEDDINTEHQAAHDSIDPGPAPHHDLQNSQIMDNIEAAVSTLPPRQQQAFLLREWEGLSVRDTATAMNCSEGSVKTHTSRALAALRQILQ